VRECTHNLLAIREANNNILEGISFQVWDATALPLEDNSIDATIVDMPFGQRHGKHSSIRTVYPKGFKVTLLIDEYCNILSQSGNSQDFEGGWHCRNPYDIQTIDETTCCK
jgi:tRNA G10  N-methylase Trm11